MKKKSPFAAAVLSLVFGPLGYLYIGWRYAALATGIFLGFTVLFTVAGWQLPTWIGLINLAVLAWKGWIIVAVRNELIDRGEEHAITFSSWPVAATVMSDLIVGMGTINAGALGLYAGVKLLLEGSLLVGLMVVFIGTPVLVWICAFVFGIIGLAINALAARGMENVFQRELLSARRPEMRNRDAN